MRAIAGHLIDYSTLYRDGDQGATGARAFLRDDDRAMTGCDERTVEHAEHLLGASDGVGTDGGERIGHAQNGKLHIQGSGARNPSSSAAFAARARQPSPETPQLNRS